MFFVNCKIVLLFVFLMMEDMWKQIKFQQNITKYRFTSFKSFLQIISIVHKNKVIDFLKCTRTLWTPCINLISVSWPTINNKTKLGKRFHLQRVSYLWKNCSNESRLC